MANVLEIIVKLDDQASDKSKKIGDNLSNLGKNVTKVGLGLTAGLTVPLGLAALKSIDMASDLEESMNKVDVVFGENAKAVVEWSTTSATKLGVTQQAALEAAGTYGNLFRALGLNVDVSQDMSTSLVGLASDLASFNNAVPLDVLEALRAGITGETEPLKKFGINLNQAGIQAKAMSMGLVDVTVDSTEVAKATLKYDEAQKALTETMKKYGAGSNEVLAAKIKLEDAEKKLAKAQEGSYGELTAAAKAQAAYQIILEQTSLAQGDFIRTSDGLANMQRIVKAQFGDLLAELGKNFLPVALQVVTTVREWLTWFQALSPEMKNTILIVGLVVAAIGPLLIIVGSLISAIGAIIPVVAAVGAIMSGPLIAVLLLVGAGIALLAYAWNTNWGNIQGITKDILSWIMNFIKKALKFILDWWNDHKTEILKTINLLWNTAKKIFQVSAEFILKLIGEVLKILMDWWGAYGADVIELITLVWNILKGLFDAGAKVVKTIIDTLLKVVGGFWKAHKTEITNLVTALWNAIKLIIQGVTKIIGEIIQAMIALIKGDWTGFGESLRAIWDTAWNTIKGVVSTIVPAIMGVINGLIRDAKSAFQNTDWASLGRSIVDGVIKGAKNMASALKKALIGIAKAAWEAAKGFLQSESPSKLFIPLGESIPAGLIKGMQNYGQYLDRATVRATSRVSTVTTHFHIQANYPYQSEKSLRQDVKRLNALYVGGTR